MRAHKVIQSKYNINETSDVLKNKKNIEIE